MKEIKSDEDCADCLCRVCARNLCNDSCNPECYAKRCECNCEIGEYKLVVTTDDCEDFLPDVDV